MSDEQNNGEIKIVIELKGTRASVGVQAPECDPVFYTAEGKLKAVLTQVPGFVAGAQERWQTAKLNPKCESPLPSQEKPAPSTPRVATRSSTKQTTAKTKEQPNMF